MQISWPYYWFALLCVLTCYDLLPVFAQCGDALLDEVRAGNQSSLESMRTLSCRITTNSPHSVRGPIPSSTAQYWWSAGSSRVRSQVADHFADSVVHAGTVRSIQRSVSPDSRARLLFSVARAVPDAPHGRFDAWDHGLLKLCGPKGWPLTLEQLLKRPHKQGPTKRQMEDGRDFIVINLGIELLPDEFGDFEIWFDPQQNYLASRIVGTSSRRAPSHVQKRRESRVVSFREVAPAFFFPEHVETRFYSNDQLTSHEVVKFTEIRVNEPLPLDVFDLSIPPGAHVIDSIKDEEFQLDAQGKQIGPVRNLVKFPPLPAGAVQPSATTAEPRPVTRWIVPGSLLVLVVAVSLWVVRKWRSAQQST